MDTVKETRWEELKRLYGKGRQLYGKDVDPNSTYESRRAPILRPTSTTYNPYAINQPTTTSAYTPPTNTYNSEGSIPVGSTSTEAPKETRWEELTRLYGKGKQTYGIEATPTNKVTPTNEVLPKEKKEKKGKSFVEKLKEKWEKAGEEAATSRTEMEKQRAMKPEELRKYKSEKYGEQKAPINLGVKGGEDLTLRALSKDKTRSNLHNIALMPLGAVGSIDKYLNSTNKFTARTSAKAHNVASGAEEMELKDTGNSLKNSAADLIGFGLGMAMPLAGGGSASLGTAMNSAGNLVERGAVSLAGKAGLTKGLVGTASKIGTASAKGYAEFGTLGAIEKAREGGNAKEIIKHAHEVGKQGAVLGGIMKSVGLASTIPKTLSDAKFQAINKKLGDLPTFKRNLFKGTGKEIEIPVVVKKPAYKGKYTIVNTAGNKAVQEYDDAIQTIQNHFKTNKLTPEEIARIKPELGIDLEALASRLGDKTDVRQIAARNWLARVADVEHTAFEPTVTKTTEQIPFSSVKRGAKVEEIPTVMTQRTYTPPRLEQPVASAETLPLVSQKRGLEVGEPVSGTRNQALSGTKEYTGTETLPMVSQKRGLEVGETVSGTRTQPLTQKIEVPAKTTTEPLWSGTEAKTLEGRTIRDSRTSGYKKGATITTTDVKQYRTEQALRGGKQKPMPKLAKLNAKEGMEVATPTVKDLTSGKVARTLKMVKGTNGKLLRVSEEGLPIGDAFSSVGAMARTESKIKILSGEKVQLPWKQRLKETYSKIVRETVDDIHALKAIGKETYMLATNAKKINATVTRIFTKALVNMEGKVIGNSLQSVVRKVPKQKEAKFFSYIAMKHNVQRAGEGKNVFTDFNVKQSQRAVATIEKLNPEFKEIGEEFVNWVNTFENAWGKGSGLISEDLWKSLQVMYKNYIPLKKGFSRIEEATANLSTNGKGLVDTGNSLKTLVKGGSERDIMNPVVNIMNLVATTVKTAKHNEVGQSLLKAFRANPKLKAMGRVLGENEKATSEAIVTVLEGGKEVRIEFKDEGVELMKVLKGMTNIKDDNIAMEAADKANKLFKAFITTSNPIFAVKNVLRDWPTSYIQGSELNPIKHFGGMLNAYKELGSNSELAEIYRSLGGEMANFVNAGKYAKGSGELMERQLLSNLKGELVGSKELSKTMVRLKAGAKALENFNNLTESAPRFAEFKRVFEKTGDVQRALFEAGEVTVNFARGGRSVKFVDKLAVPYLNASIQGLDKFFRTVDPRNPKKAAQVLLKAGLAVTVPQAFFHHINKDNPNYQALDNRTKDNYFLIPVGEKFIKIPKTREYGFLMGTLFDRVQRAYDGDATTKGLGESFGTAFLPNSPISNNLLTPYLKMKIGGKDVKDWAGRPIIPQGLTADDRSKYLQYDEKSTEIAKWFSDVVKNFPMAGMLQSPKRIDYLIDSYTGILSQVVVPQLTAATKAGAKTRPQRLVKSVVEQFQSDPLYSNQATTDFYDNKDKILNQTTDEKLLLSVPKEQATYLKEAKKYYEDTSEAIAERYTAINLANEANNEEEVKRLRKEIIQLASQANSAYKPAPKINYKALKAE